jgi:hypothetical protein
MSPIEEFAAAAVRFENWLLDGRDIEAEAARHGLQRLVELYQRALDLPQEWSPELETSSDDLDRVHHSQWQRAVHASRRLPFDSYREVFNPAGDVAEDAVTRSLADDFADVYRDVASGLRMYQDGKVAAAVWEWSFAMRVHWGAHATSAIRALHWWLADNAPERLPASSAAVRVTAP